jgi:hypothetical protein
LPLHNRGGYQCTKVSLGVTRHQSFALCDGNSFPYEQGVTILSDPIHFVSRSQIKPIEPFGGVHAQVCKISQTERAHLYIESTIRQNLQIAAAESYI